MMTSIRPSLYSPLLIGSTASGANKKTIEEVVVQPASRDTSTTSASPAGDISALTRRALDKATPISYKTNDSDLSETFENFDRRSLYAVASDEGGVFTEEEQAGAKWIMWKQEEKIMYEGFDPTDVSDPSFMDNLERGSKRVAQFLDSVSPEERSSSSWAIRRAGVQSFHNLVAERNGHVPEDETPSNEFVSLLSGLQTRWNSNNQGNINLNSDSSLAEVLEQPWARSFRLAIIDAFENTYGVVPSKSIYV